jgi:hypothetical protein
LRCISALLGLVLVAAVLAGCGGGSHSTSSSTGTPASGASILNSSRENVTFADVDAAIRRLYEVHPNIRTFVVRDVEYNPRTRDKVLDICHRGGLELDRAALESSRVAGCAPLIFFFYNYGRQKNAPDSTAVARRLYWYAVENIRGPFGARSTIDSLLRTWAVE